MFCFDHFRRTLIPGTERVLLHVTAFLCRAFRQSQTVRCRLKALAGRDVGSVRLGAFS